MTDAFDKTQLSDTGVAGPGDAPSDEHDEAYCSACNQSFALDREVCPNDGARLIKLKAGRDVLVGRVFDARYELRAQLGHGGMGTVYRAHQISVDREVAIKVIHPKLASDRTAVKRFLRETRLASRLSQPNIVNVYDFGQTDDGILYLVMELLRGHTLARELDAKAALPVRRVETIALQLCDALEVAHRADIVHRDLKPSNIIILDEPPGRDLVKVLDFGLAKSLVSDTSSLTTNSDAILGTPLYMPPEQIGGVASDARADLYSLGCILHHMLRGTPPFVRDSVNLVLAAHLHERPPPLPASVPPRIARLVQRMMEKDPAHRPGSAAEVRAVLQAADEPEHAALAYSPTDPSMPAAPPESVEIARPRRRVWPIAAALAMVAGIGVAGYLVHTSSQPPPAPDARGAPALPQLPIMDAAPVVPVIPAAADAAITPPARDAPVRPRPHVERDAAPAPPRPTVDAPNPTPTDAMPSINFVH